MERSQLESRFEKAKAIARKASVFLLSHEELRTEISSKAENDYVTSADRECEKIIIDAIRQSFPSDPILGEETGENGKGRVRWIIDPIDGTVDFMASFPDYAVSIGFEEEDGIAFGVVSIPRQGELFSAIRGNGAFLNDKRIFTDERMPLSKSLAILVPPHRHHELLSGYMTKMERFYSVVSDMRSIGSAAASLCYVACGRACMYYELGLHIYDLAAGAMILTEAGGRITFFTDDESSLDIAASSASAHDAMLECING